MMPKKIEYVDIKSYKITLNHRLAVNFFSILYYSIYPYPLEAREQLMATTRSKRRRLRELAGAG